MLWSYLPSRQLLDPELGVFSLYDTKNKRPFCNAFTGAKTICYFVVVEEKEDIVAVRLREEAFGSCCGGIVLLG